MKRKWILPLLIAMIFTFCSVLQVSAQTTYKVQIYSGSQGHFAGDTKVWEQEFEPGDTVDISLSDLGYELDNSKYYVRGFRITGHDNDETTGFQNLNFVADTDVSYEVAYGLKGALVSYTVQYQDENGNTLRSNDKLYGMPGDKPVVAYRYVEGYQPRAYNLAKTLSTDESQNIITFIYDKAAANGGNNNGNNNNGGNNNGNNGNGGNGGRPGPQAPGTAFNPAGTNAPQGAEAGISENAQIGDIETPQASTPQQYQDLDQNGSSTDNSYGSTILIGLAAAMAALLALLVFLIRRRGEEDEEEES
ncbi:MAG: hypothetical protein IJH75_05660 [Mogibacterium sp.]|nr:hypothetical protein [Mogibacterium sp.]